MRDRNLILYYTLGISLVAFVLGVASTNAILCIISLLLALLSIALSRGWYIVEALLFAHSNLVEVCAKYELEGARDSAFIKKENSYKVVVAAELDGSQRQIQRDSIEEMISRINFPFKFIVNLKRANAQKLLNSLKTKRAMKELNLSKLGNQKRYEAKIGALKREIETLNNEIETIEKSTPFEIVRYISTEASAESKIMAEERAKRQLSELMSHFSALTGAGCRMLSGDELIEAISL
ncbi:MAG: hypothetical protein ACP5SA_02340 [Candidatus Micrarchaeia archaeon]